MLKKQAFFTNNYWKIDNVKNLRFGEVMPYLKECSQSQNDVSDVDFFFEGFPDNEYENQNQEDKSSVVW